MTRPVVARLIGAAIACLWASPGLAQESQFMSDLRREGDHIAESCSSVQPKALGGCAYTLISSYPIHLALGSLAPGNGFAFGVALSERYTPNETWRLTFSGDAVRSVGGSYRIGAYTKFIHAPKEVGVVVTRPGDPPVAPRRLKLDTWVIDVFGQRTSLEDINYFGPGPSTFESGRTSFGQQQTMFGSSVVLPMSGKSWMGALRPALMGGVTWRVVNVRPGKADGVPSVHDAYTNAGAPGLDRQDPFLELREGVRFRPSLPNGRLSFNYVLTAQQFRTSVDSRSSFNRWTVNLQHSIPFYRGVSSSGPPADFNGPNECSAGTDSLECPPLERSRARTGAIGLRVLMSTSSTNGENRVPFYFQPTIGGSDINGERLLAAFADYRFRGPNVLALQQSIEHSLWGPVGVFAAAEQGNATRARRELGFDDLVASYSVGLTIRAGGMPMITLSFAWGAEGHHIIGAMNNSLLGGGGRPSLY